jgi:hypothetical protein
VALRTSSCPLPVTAVPGRPRRLWLPALLGMLTAGCSNPFAPPLGDPVSIWRDQTTLGGLLENFRSAYERRDSLRYAECLSCSDYRFNYFDPSLGDYAWMPREVDLATTGRLFRHFSRVELRWIGLGEELATIDAIDSLVSFTVFFELGLGVEVIYGHARFSALRSSPGEEACQSPIYGDQAVFRLQQWDDDL